MTAKIDNYSFLEKELEFAKLEIANLHDDISEWMDRCERLEAKIECIQSNLSASAQAFVQLGAVAAEARDE